MDTYTERLNIAMSPEQYQNLRAIAYQRRTSMAAVVRAAIDSLIGPDDSNITATCNHTTTEGASCDNRN